MSSKLGASHIQHAPVGVSSAPAPRGVFGVIAGFFGELLLTLGVLLLLFVAWQNFYTDIIAGNTSSVARQELVKEWSTVTSPDSVATKEHRENPPEEIASYAENTKFGLLYVPKFGKDTPITVAEGVNLETVLNTIGAGHYMGQAMPGQLGNFSVAGHRTTYGRPFYDIDQLQNDDPIIMETKDNWYVYKVYAHEVVLPADGSVAEAVPRDPNTNTPILPQGSTNTDPNVPTDRLMTLTACEPKFSAAKRYIVHAVLDYWVPKAEGYPKELGAMKPATFSAAGSGPSVADTAKQLASSVPNLFNTDVAPQGVNDAVVGQPQRVATSTKE